VSTLTLRQNSYIFFQFSLRRRGSIKFYVEAEQPVDTFVVDEDGFREFEAGRQCTIYGGFEGQQEHRQEVRVPYEGTWYLIISNPSYQPVAVHHEVY
jgi:hypothetical protein